jgi:tetratricopeptide (TPR) repeat protein
MLEVEIAHAQAGNVEQASQAGRQFAAIKSTSGLNPSRVAEAAIAQFQIGNVEIARERFRLAMQLAAAVEVPARAELNNELCWQAGMNGVGTWALKTCDEAVRLDPGNINFLTEAAIAYARAGDRNAARDRFLRAVQLASKETDDRAEDNNEVCWRGALYNFAQEVRPACDLAVSLDTNVAYRDSQAVAYALIGTPELLRSANDSFKAFAGTAKGRTTTAIEMRKKWSAQIDSGRNPFAADSRAAVLEALTKEFEDAR